MLGLSFVIVGSLASAILVSFVRTMTEPAAFVPYRYPKLAPLLVIVSRIACLDVLITRPADREEHESEHRKDDPESDETDCYRPIHTSRLSAAIAEGPMLGCYLASVMIASQRLHCAPVLE